MRTWYLDYASDSAQGASKPVNQDAVFTAFQKETGLFAVCDGMGGHSGGENASRMIVEALGEWWKSFAAGMDNQSDATIPLDKIHDIGAVKESLIACLQAVNTEIYKLAAKNDITMGSTVTLMFIEGDSYIIISIGDSRVYHIKHGGGSPMTLDHSWAFEQIANGNMTEKEAEEHPFRNKLTQAVGGVETLSPFSRGGKLLENDCFVICSDGLYKAVPVSAWFDGAPSQLASGLASCAMGAAAGHGAEDDVSVIILKCESSTKKRSFFSRLFSKNK